MRPKYFFFLIIVCTVVTLSSCAKRIGYGLVVWGEEGGPVQTGQILPIQQESQIQNTYLLRLQGTKELVEVPTWRIRLFPDMERAAQGAEEYAPYLDMYAYSQRDGLPIREEPDQEARRVYKLAEGQLVKVLARGEKKVQISNYDDFWYLVLTEDGYQGYCFGYYLPVFSTAGDPLAEVEVLMARDPMLEVLKETAWRPEYFQEMVDTGRIDLTSFGPQFGFFVDTEAKQVHLVTSRRAQSYRYERIEKVGANRYVFEGPDIDASGIRVNMQSRQRIVVTYASGSQILSAVFIAFSDEIEKIIVEERERRERLLDTFRSRGRILGSTAYGNIYLEEGIRFRWENYGGLGERIFLERVRGSGDVDFVYHLSAALAVDFEGVITFHFDEYSADEGTSFLYTFDSAGVRFEYIRPQDIENLEVVRRDDSPLVIYFSFGGS